MSSRIPHSQFKLDVCTYYLCTQYFLDSLEARSLDEQFSLTALAHIEIVTGIKAFHSLACGETDADAAVLLQGDLDDLTGQGSTIKHSRVAFNEWVIRDVTHTWKALVKVFRDMGMQNVAQSIEDLFTVSKVDLRIMNSHPV